MLNTQDATKYLGVSRSRLYKFVTDKKLKIFKRKDNSKISYFSLHELDKIKDEFKEFVAVDFQVEEHSEKVILSENNHPSTVNTPGNGLTVGLENGLKVENGTAAKPISKKSRQNPETIENNQKHTYQVGSKILKLEGFDNPEPDYFDHILNRIGAERPNVNLDSLAAMGRVQRLAQFIDARFEKLSAPYGLKQHEYLVLATIKREGADHALTPTEIYKSLAIPSGSITKRIDRLEALEMVEREQNPKDRRGVKIRLTSKGIELLHQFESQPHLLYNWMVESLSPEELATFITTLRKLLYRQEQNPAEFEPEKPD